jgi:hypothetical protein
MNPYHLVIGLMLHLTHTRVINCKIEGELKRKVKNYQPNTSRDCEGVTKGEDACNSSR